MTTNLLATIIVAVVTNLTSSNITENVGCPYGFGCLVYGCDRQPKWVVKGKIETKEIVEITTITFDLDQLKRAGWIGGFLEGIQRRVLSSESKTFKHEDNWIEEKK